MSFYHKINAIIPQRKTQVFREGAQRIMFTPLPKPEPLPEPYIPTSEDKLIGRLGPTLYMDNQRIKQARRAKGIQTPRPEQFKDEIDRLINENKMSGKGWWNNIKNFLRKKSTNETAEEHKDEEEEDEEEEEENIFSEIEEKLNKDVVDMIKTKYQDVIDIEEEITELKSALKKMKKEFSRINLLQEDFWHYNHHSDPALDKQMEEFMSRYVQTGIELKELKKFKKLHRFKNKSKPKSCSSKDK